MMKKIRCPRCGVINLEKFVTYPHCAGCGGSLPQEAGNNLEYLPIWRRPLGPLLWVTAIGSAVVGLVLAATLFEKAPDALKRVIVYGRAPRTAEAGQRVTAYFTIDNFDASTQRKQLRNVKLRLPKEFFTKFHFVALDPAPGTTTNIGTGRYFQYASLPRETELRLTLHAVEPGTHPLAVRVYADDHYPSPDYNTIIQVRPKRDNSQPDKPAS